MRLEDLSPEGLRALINEHRDEVLEVPVSSAAVIEDIDRRAPHGESFIQSLFKLVR